MERILLVDDDPLFLELASMRLQGRGYDVVAARDGVEALGLLGRHKIDLIVLDIRMPRMDGFQFLERIRSESSIPVLVLTEVEAPSVRERALVGGATAMMVKPFDARELDRKIGEFLRGEPASRPQATVCVLEDDAVCRTAIGVLVAGMGLNVLQAGSYREMIRLIGAEKPALFLVDLTLPEVDGLETCAALRRDARYAETPIVVVTGSPDPERLEKARAIGADAVLPKPLTREALAEALERLR